MAESHYIGTKVAKKDVVSRPQTSHVCQLEVI